MSTRTEISRRGVSLTELLILMSSCTMILTMSSVLLHRVMRVQIDSRSLVDAERTSARLSRQFRQDVHQATAAQLDSSKFKNKVFLQLQLADNRTIQYRWASGKVLRTVSLNDKVTAREEFAFQPACKLAIHENESPKRIILSIASPALEPSSNNIEQLQSYKAVPVSLQVEASLNRGPMSAGATFGQEQPK